MRAILISSLVSLFASSIYAKRIEFGTQNAILHVPKTFGSKILTDGTISYDEASRIISDIAGLSSLKKSETVDFSKTSAAYLLVVGHGVDSIFPNLDKFDITPEDTKNSIKTWKMLRGGDSIDTFNSPASVLEVFGQANPGSMQISLSSNPDYLNSISVDKQFVSNSNAASILIKNLNSKLASPSKISSSLNDIVNEELSKNVNHDFFSNGFDLSSPCDKSFIGEFTALVELNKLIQSDSQLLSLVRDDIPDYYSIAFSSLWELQKVYGADSEKYKTAKSQSESMIQRIKKTLDELYGTVTEQVISFNGESLGLKISSHVSRRDIHDSLSPCFTSLEACQNSTTNCTSKGNCVEVKKRVVNGVEESCYKCDCTHGYTGDFCEFEDKVALFHLILWTSIMLIVALVLVVVTLAYMDPGTDTLLFRTGSQRPKSE